MSNDTGALSPSAQPLRTWRPMIGWTLAILAALGLAWFVGAVAVPVWGTSRAVDRCHEFYIANTLIEDRILGLLARTLPDPQIETLDGAREEAA